MLEFINELRIKNVSIEIIDKAGIEWRKKCEEKFADNLSSLEKGQIYLDYYLWHIFSYQIVICLEIDDTMSAFDSIKKDECFVFFQNSDTVIKMDHLKNIKAEDFNNENDIYIVDKNLTWTYVHTHEVQCGPYFYKIDITYEHFHVPCANSFIDSPKTRGSIKRKFCQAWLDKT